MTDRERTTRHGHRGGFTLVEMLTVIVIIGILAGLIVGASIVARNAARRAVMKTEIGQLTMALQDYKGEVGEFPPDFAFVNLPAGTAHGDAARARVVRHVRKAWPRMTLAGSTTNDQFNDFVAKAGVNVSDLTPATAMTFWLGGIADSDGKPRGFHTDPGNPFKTGEPRNKPYFDFDVTRLVSGQYMPARIVPQAPYVYFRPVRNTTSGNYEYGDDDGSGNFVPFAFGSGDNICVAYLEDASTIYTAGGDPDPVLMTDTRKWRAPETYQIISGGLDGEHSSDIEGAGPRPFRVSGYGLGFSDGDYDNLASFAEGELEDEL